VPPPLSDVNLDFYFRGSNTKLRSPTHCHVGKLSVYLAMNTRNAYDGISIQNTSLVHATSQKNPDNSSTS
jgi:hypothetical protein